MTRKDQREGGDVLEKSDGMASKIADNIIFKNHS
jgi:hypothetical protein